MSQSDACNCCTGLEAQTPKRVYNPAGQPAVAYRVGRHSDFLKSMKARLSSTDLSVGKLRAMCEPEREEHHGEFLESMTGDLSSTDFSALHLLTTREPDDFSIALCDAAAVVLDVLSFYQERIANENFLRTARERRSILELAQLIGYSLGPGVAASTWLAFTLQETPGLPAQVLEPVPVPLGTRVQSVPGPGETPQTFETVETIEARADWNALPVQTAVAWQPRRGDTELYLAGISTGLTPGDAVLIVGQGRMAIPDSKQWKPKQWNLRIVEKVEPDNSQGYTRISWHDGLSNDLLAPEPEQDFPQVYVLRQRAGLFGHNAPDPRLMSQRDTQLCDMLEPESCDSTKRRKWKNYHIGSDYIELDAAYPKIIPNSWMVLVPNEGGTGSTSLPDYMELYRAQAVSVVSRTDFGLSGRTTRIKSYEDLTLSPEHYTIDRTLVLAQSEELSIAARPLNFPLFGAQVTLASMQQALHPAQALALSGKRQRIEIVEDATGLVLNLEDGGTVPLMPGDSLQMIAAPIELFKSKWQRSTIVDGVTDLPLKLEAGDTVPITAGNSLTMIAAPPRINRVFRGADIHLTPEQFGNRLGTRAQLRLSLRDRDGRVGNLTTFADQIRLQPALEQDETLAEMVFVKEANTAVEHGRDGTTLHLTASMRHIYDRQSVRINANVASATHGETVNETLGGTTGKPDQRFTLQQPPLTHVSAATASGRASSLALRVNDLLWRELPSLYGQGPNDRVFTTALEDNGRTTVIFGDGIEGARPPSGQDNIRVRYRKGIGIGGNVAAGKLSNLLTRPLGVSGVTNPEAARGGQDAQTADAARENAPLTVLTLDRVVSVQDYEDFSRSFAGIAKAHATSIAAGPGRGIFITVAGEEGNAIDESSDTFKNLLAALRRCGDALLPLRISSYRRVTFRLRVAIKMTADADTNKELKCAEAALRQAFGFAARHFGQPVSVDEVSEVLHRSASVQAVNVIELYRAVPGAAPSPKPLRLFARLPEASLTALPQAAELLTLDAALLTLEVMP